MKRAILLQTVATGNKIGILRAFVDKATECSNWILSKRVPKESAADLQARVLKQTREKYGFNVQVVCSIVRGLAKSRSDTVAGITVKFNMPRNRKTFRTRSFLFVELGMYPGHRIAIPLRRNRNLDRFLGSSGAVGHARPSG